MLVTVNANARNKRSLECVNVITQQQHKYISKAIAITAHNHHNHPLKILIVVAYLLSNNSSSRA